MTREEIKEKLADIMLMAMPDAGDTIKNYTEDSDLNTDLGLNSIGMLYLVIAIEEFFSLSFENADFGDFKTVGNVIDYIEQKQQG